MSGGRLPPRVLLGALAGLLFFAVDALASLVRYLLFASVAERATAGAFAGMLGYLALFVAAGALAGYLSGLRARLPRFLLIGALVGAVGWSYLTVTWSLTARPGAFIPPQMDALGAALAGAGLGALGGLLLFVIGAFRSRHD